MKRLLLYLLIALVLCGCGGEERTYQFLHRGVEIPMNAPAGPILYALGQPISCTQEPSCAFAGMETTYHHGSFVITTYTLEGSEYIGSLWFADDTVATGEGLRLGDSRQRAEELYPEISFGELRGEAQWKDGFLTVLLEENRVSGIRYDAKIPD